MFPNPKYNIWEHSANIRDLYAQRAKGVAEEMACARQAAEILAPLIKPGMTLLDAGCGSGYYYWSFKRRGLPIEYYGIDYSPSLIEIGRQNLVQAGLDPLRLQVGMIEDLEGQYDIVLCFNTLPWVPMYHQAVERLCQATRHYLLVRTALGEKTLIRYEVDGYLEGGYNQLKAYWNIYALDEFTEYIRGFSFRVHRIVDQRTGDGVEMVVGKPFPWKILFCQRTAGTGMGP